MDDFVCNKLTEWGLSKYIDQFKEEEIDKEGLYCLKEKAIDEMIKKQGPRAKFKKNLKLLQEEQKTANQETVDSSALLNTVSSNQVSSQCQQEHEEEAQSAQVQPSTSGTGNNGKRELDLQGESSSWQSPTKKPRHETRLGSYTENIILTDVKNIMRCVYERLPHQDNKLNKFLKDKISDLETDKRELVGVFGKTGAGKSSLINAVIGHKNLLPSGRISACTTVMIKVEANMQNSKYEADIEFITKEEWKDELWVMFNFLRNNADQEDDQDGDDDDDDDDDDHRDTVDKLSALYGEEWKNKTPEELMDGKYFREIPEFLNSRRKILTCESGKDLSAQCVKYTRTDSQDGDVKGWYWPLVKCVTVRVPHNDLLRHVTLVDLPGNGDRNKSRDKMWKEVVGRCSIVWIVTENNRPTAEKEPWEILENASSLMGNGGECQQIHFICTKSDQIGDSDDHSAARALIINTNKKAKEEVTKEFRKQNKVQKHFSEDCFKVFTVSSKEFFKKTHLNPVDTEIPKLQEFLQNLNDDHSEALNYVSGAHGILSLIQGARCRDVADKKTDVCRVLEENMKHELDKVRKSMEETYETFDKHLSEGVENSKSSCEKVLKSALYPPKPKGGGFHKILRCIVENGGMHKTKKGKQINLNIKLASHLTDSIDEEFKKTFPNERKSGPFNGVINTFSLDTEKLIEKYEDVELQLIFLNTEEKKIKTKINKIIRECKKIIYSSLMTTIEENMQECYERAAGFKGKDSLRNMRDTIEKHVRDPKNIMFEQAKALVLSQLRRLKDYVLKILEETMQKSMELSLKTDSDLLPDVTVELAEVIKYYNELKTPQVNDH